MQPIIELKALTKIYEGDPPVVAIENVDLTVEQGDVFGIIGLSGAGKSTLVRCINLLEKPTSGEVIVNGQSLTHLSKKELLKARRSIGMIFQHYNLLEQRTALKNVCFPLEINGVPKKQAEAKAKELLALVGLADKENSYPSQLSGGQKQRVAIARALANEPTVLLCDEATSALDPSTTEAILELLKHINKTLGLTVVIITHEMKVVEKICNKVAVIDNSRVAECGNIQDVFLSPKTDISKKIIYSGHINTPLDDSHLLKLIFNGEINTPLVSNIIRDCNITLSIIYADSKVVDNRIYGQLIFSMPAEESDAQKLLKYLQIKGIHYEEVTNDDLR